MSNPLIKEALDYEASFNSDKDLREKYIAREEAILDEKLRAGHNRAVGIKEGIKEGANKKAIQIAQNMLKDNMSIDLVAKYSGLSISQIKNLK